MVNAQGPLSPPEAFSNLETLSVSPVISWAISLLMIIAAVLFFFMFLFGGIRWIISGGKKEKTDKAKSQIIHAFIGLFIVFGAWMALSFASETFGVNLMQLAIPSINN